jgi:hypothetical protein
VQYLASTSATTKTEASAPMALKVSELFESQMDRIGDVLMEIFNVSIWWFSYGCLCVRRKILFDGRQHYNIAFEYNYQCKLLINIKRYLQKINFTRGRNQYKILHVQVSS